MAFSSLSARTVLFLSLALAAGCSGDGKTGHDGVGPGARGDGDIGDGDIGDGDVGDGDSDEEGGDGDRPGNGNEFGDGDVDGGDGDVELPPFEGDGDPWLKPVPRATCAPGDKPDGELQGANGDVICNLELANQVEASHYLSLAWYKDCAYVNGTDGTSVIRVAADGTPTVTTKLTQVGFTSNWESMKASAASGLLVGFQSNLGGLGVFDLKGDCADPTFAGSIDLVGAIGHSGNFGPDGTIYYASSMYTATVYAVDLLDPTQPKVLTTDFGGVSTHDLNVSPDGKRAYFTNPSLVGSLGKGAAAIVDISEIQERKPNPKGTLIKQWDWPDGNISQFAIPLTIRGRAHMLISDELGSGNCLDPNKPIWGYARIFDISDEQNPKLVSLLKTEAQDPEFCSHPKQSTTQPFGIGTHYCNVDRLDDPRLVACGIWEGGVRVYDVRNPWRPVEVAYFDVPNGDMPGLARIYVEKRELWIALTSLSSAGQFYVLKFPEGSPVDRILSE